MMMNLIDPTDPVLLGKAEPVAFPSPSLSRITADMFATMIQNHGCGLAAPQIGIPLRLFTYRVGNELGVVINPLILERGQRTIESREGCLSFPGEFWTVQRFTEILLKYQDLSGKSITRRFGVGEDFNERRVSDMLAIIFQHEIDHLDGILINQHGVKDTTE